METKIKEENLSGSIICQQEDRIDIIEKVVSISSFYNFYYPLEINREIINLIKKIYAKFKFNEPSLRLTCAIAYNGFNFDNNLLSYSKELLESDKNDYVVFEKIKNDSIKLAQVVNSIEPDYNINEIVSFCLDFFELKKYISHNNILNLIFNTELLSNLRKGK